MNMEIENGEMIIVQSNKVERLSFTDNIIQLFLTKNRGGKQRLFFYLFRTVPRAIKRELEGHQSDSDVRY